MSDSQVVDLLLVRLNREEEKEKVLEMLIVELGLSRDEAREKVETSPNILSEGISMEQARILQNRMYPFVDLLPRSYATATYTEPSAPSDDDIFSESFQDDKIEIDTQDEYQEEEIQDFEVDEDNLIITTAAEEILSIDRCHLCGRSPTSDQKLAPCRTCGELTCSDCFNRKMHVCERCVSEGRAVDRPLDVRPDFEREQSNANNRKLRSDDGEKKISGGKKRVVLPKISPAVISISAIVIILIAFFLIDPINLFGTNDSERGSDHSAADSITTSPIPDSDSISSTVPAEVPSDTLENTQTDSLPVSEDSISTESASSAGIISLRDIRIPDFPDTPEPDEITLPRLLLSSPVRGIEVFADSLSLLSYPLGYIAATISLTIDAISLVHTEDGYTIFVMTILHPEPVEKRTALISSVGALLDSTVVDQMVLYYRENEYYESNLFSFISDSFSVISQSNSPYFLQRKQATLPEIRTLIFEGIHDWMTDLN